MNLVKDTAFGAKKRTRFSRENPNVSQNNMVITLVSYLNLTMNKRQTSVTQNYAIWRTMEVWK
ncbi:hypothetical protein X975_22578, partial [Stegodyphus mimosarum]